MDAVYRTLRGVTDVVSGYTGGETESPTYEQVCTGHTGHAEAVRVEYDPEVIPTEIILNVFFTLHDPTQLNRQGHDVGTQYRSAMYYRSEDQRELMSAARDRARAWWPGTIVTELSPLGMFFPAEEYHQDFFTKNPGQGYCMAVAVPKVQKIRATFTEYIR
ncbi:peptide-methionine (S)-S-oxide reductase MsrA [Klugiella xanthotipulae]